MSSFFALLAIAMLIEALLTYGQSLYHNKKIAWQIIAGFVLGLVFCYDTGLNFFEAVGLPEKYPMIGYVCTAIVLSRGSNFVFEFYERLYASRRKAEGVM